MLAGNPDLTTLEEQDNFRDAHRELLLAPVRSSAGVRLPPETLGEMAAEYWRRVRAESRAARAGHLHRQAADEPRRDAGHPPAVPGCEVRLALRDPRDVIVSCFRNHFAVNAAMYQFLTLETAARYYDAVMTSAESRASGCRSRPCPALGGRRLRPPGRGDELMGFLGQPWTDDVLKYMETASRREIYTPSATQVIEPIYKSAMGQWRRYEAELAPVLPVLEPWDGIRPTGLQALLVDVEQRRRAPSRRTRRATGRSCW